MKTLIFSPEELSLEAFYIGLILNLLGSMIRRFIEYDQPVSSTTETLEPDPLGRHPFAAKILMYPLKVFGYIFIISAICLQLRLQGETRLTLWYTLFLVLLVSTPLVFKAKKGFPAASNWYMQKSRITTGRILMFCAALIAPSSIFMRDDSTPLALKIFFWICMFELFFFRSRERKAWHEKGFDWEKVVPLPDSPRD